MVENQNKKEEELLESFAFEEGDAEMIRLGSDSLAPENRDDLIRNLVETNFTLESVPLASLRNTIRERMVSICQRLKATGIGAIANLPIFDTVQHAVYPDYSRKENLDGTEKALNRMIYAGEVCGIRVDNSIVAIQAVRKHEKQLRGRDTYEFTKASTIDGYKGKRLNPMLKSQMAKEIDRENDNAHWVSMSRNPDHIQKLASQGWEVIDLSDSSSDVAQFLQEDCGDYWSTVHRQGYKGLYFDPNRA